MKCGPSHENFETKKELDRGHGVPMQVLAVELFLENCLSCRHGHHGHCGVCYHKTWRTANPNRHKRGAVDSPQDGKAEGNRWLLCSEPTCLCVARRVGPISLLRALKVGFWREWLSWWYSPKTNQFTGSHLPFKTGHTNPSANVLGRGTWTSTPQLLSNQPPPEGRLWVPIHCRSGELVYG